MKKRRRISMGVLKCARIRMIRVLVMVREELSGRTCWSSWVRCQIEPKELNIETGEVVCKCGELKDVLDEFCLSQQRNEL